MINAAIVGASLASAMKHAAPNVEAHYGEEGKNTFMQLVMEQLQGVGAANGLTHVRGGVEVHEAPAQSVGNAMRNSGVSIA